MVGQMNDGWMNYYCESAKCRCPLSCQGPLLQVTLYWESSVVSLINFCVRLLVKGLRCFIFYILLSRAGKPLLDVSTLFTHFHDSRHVFSCDVSPTIIMFVSFCFPTKFIFMMLFIGKISYLLYITY